jgi:hypothetical protein
MLLAAISVEIETEKLGINELLTYNSVSAPGVMEDLSRWQILGGKMHFSGSKTIIRRIIEKSKRCLHNHAGSLPGD